MTFGIKIVFELAGGFKGALVGPHGVDKASHLSERDGMRDEERNKLFSF